MAVRIIRKQNDPVLRKVARAVKQITPQVIRVLEDMADTMYHANGVGLAGPQVGISKRLVVVDQGDSELIELINPEILKAEGEELGVEGCLSFPGLYGKVPRAVRVTVQALNRDNEQFLIHADGLLARILQHEIDHLNGILFIDKVTEFVEVEDGEATS